MDYESLKIKFLKYMKGYTRIPEVHSIEQISEDLITIVKTESD